MAKGQMRATKEKKKPKADKDKPKQLSAYKLAQMQGSSGSSFSTPPGKKTCSLALPGGARLGRFRQLLRLLRHLEAGQQFDVTGRTAERRESHAAGALRRTLLCPVLLQLAVRIFFITLTVTGGAAERNRNFAGTAASLLDIELWYCVGHQNDVRRGQYDRQ